MPRAPNRFRINAKNYFLTFPQCAISKEEAIQQLQSLPYTVPPKYIRVAQETHQDGNLHLHCLIQFEGKYQCTNNRFFNLLSTSRSGHFHPNVQGARSSTDINAYISKHGDFIEWGNFQIDGRSARGCTTAIGDAYAEALNSTNKEAALRVIKEKDPKNYFLQFHKINANLDRIFAPVEEPFQSKWDPLSFNVPNDMKQWAEDNVLIDAAARPDRPISLILEGESRLGKTAWARSLGPHNYLSGHLDFSSKSYSNNALYNIIIDDISPKYLTKKHWKELIGAKRDWQANCKHSKPVQIKGGIPAIVLCRPGADSSYKEFLDRDENKALKEWTLKNAQFEFITEPMFSAARRVPPTPVQEEEEL